jgi:hypothetical protein
MAGEQKPYNLRRAPHLIANEVVRRIEGYLWEGGIGVKFGKEGHAIIEQLVIQYQDELFRVYNSGDDTSKAETVGDWVFKYCGCTGEDDPRCEHCDPKQARQQEGGGDGG